jgi:TolA-binding protein
LHDISSTNARRAARAVAPLLRALGLALALAGSTACSTLAFWRDDEDEASAAAAADEKAAAAVEPPAPAPAAKSLVEEQELKLAKLWARVDELEEEQYRQKERIRVLEKGMTLGLVPEELKKAKPEPPKPKAPPKAEVAPPEPPKEPKTSDATLSKEEREAYEKAFADAHDLFRQGRYAHAIAKFASIDQEYGPKLKDGAHKYWIAQCWFNMKEYQTAQQIDVEFIREHPSSPWVPRAKFLLGRVEWELGQQTTAIETYRSIQKDHPYADAAELARMELERLDKKL